ncbi:transporter [Algibacter aquimarinus]
MLIKKSISIVFIICASTMYAQTCCSGGIPLSNNIGMSVEEKGTFQLSLNYDYNNLNTLNNGTEKLNDDSRLRITNSILFNISYAVTNRLSVEGLFTWVNQRRVISQFGNENLDQTSGIGDGLLLLKYNFKNGLGKNSNIELGLGAKIPFGSSTETNNQGITLNADLQPGSNAWDVVYFLSASKQANFRPSLTFSGRIIYRSTGTNNSYFENSSYKFGNEIQTFLGVSDQFSILKTLATPSISLKYRDAKQDEIDGFNLDNTGGNWLFIIPDFSINIKPNLVFSTRAELPLYSNVDGTQLTPTYRITTGFLFKIKPKSKLLNLR